jgi:hypothetical protein
MKQWFWIAMVAASVSASGCSWVPKFGDGAAAASPAATTERAAPPVASNEIKAYDANGALIIQKVEFRTGVSSATVEKLAKEHGCNGSSGAGLITKNGPVEVYRMVCDNGKAFLAQCELRQCRPMR